MDPQPAMVTTIPGIIVMILWSSDTPIIPLFAGWGVGQGGGSP